MPKKHTRYKKIDRNRKLTISAMTGKLSGFYGINTSPLDNPYCTKNTHAICRKCYSKKMLQTIRKPCRPAWKRNGEILSETVYPADTWKKLFKPDDIVRFSAHGELLNRNHLYNLINIATENPETTFALWTKRKYLITDRTPIPSNMHMIYSEPDLDIANPEVPGNFNKVFAVYTDDRVSTNCSGQRCADCMLCYTHNNTTIIREALR